MLKNSHEDNRTSSEDPEHGHLIYIINKEVEFNDELVTITYFKDITLGVLYE